MPKPTPPPRAPTPKDLRAPPNAGAAPRKPPPRKPPPTGPARPPPPLTWPPPLKPPPIPPPPWLPPPCACPIKAALARSATQYNLVFIILVSFIVVLLNYSVNPISEGHPPLAAF